MTTANKATAAILFALVLLILGATDAFLTQSIISEQPTNSASPDPFAVFTEADIETQETNEASLIRSVIPEHIAVITRVMLRDNDRIGFIAMADAPETKDYLFELKTRLQRSFSKDVKDLRDTVQTPDGKPQREILTFQDPAIHPERLVFVHVRTRLYELHVTPGTEEEMNDLLEQLTE